MKNSRYTATALVFLLCAGGLSAATGATKAALSPPALAALSQLRSQYSSSGFDLIAENAVEDVHGISHVRLQQTYHGIPMWGAQGMLQVGHDGSSSTQISSLVNRDLGLDVTPAVTTERALKTVLTRLAPAAPLEQNPNAELVLFPAVHRPRLKFTTSLENGEVVRRLDTEHSALGRSKDKGDWSLAYHVHTEVSDRKEGPRHTDYIVDARSGEILEIWDSLRRDQAPHSHPAQNSALVPPLEVKGVGHSEYSGDVMLDVLDDRANSGQFILQDTFRGIGTGPDLADDFGVPNPATGEHGITVYNMGILDRPNVKFANPTGAWGDGLLWNGDVSDYTGVNSETAAVDALHGTEVYWDMLHNVFRQRGLVFTNPGISLRVHRQLNFTFWNPSQFGVDVADFLFGPLPQSIAMPEVMAHELTHGVVAGSAALDGRGETAAVEESFCDAFSALLKFYAGGANAAGSVIPDTDGSPSGQDAWTFGLQVLGDGSNPFYPIRSMSRPQADGLSIPTWFHGVSNADPHFTSGIGNRAFYFLSQGAAPYTGPDDAVASSAYVPAGFPGIGNQKAALLYFDAMFQQLPSTANYHVLRLALKFAAFNRFGPDSPEYAAVENALAAVNVGAAHGQPERPLVSLEATSSNLLQSVIDDTTVGIAVIGVPSKPFSAKVSNAVNTSVDWTSPVGGQLSQDGTYTPPNLHGYVLPLVATSQADPMEFAEGFAVILNADVNDDREVDALDALDLAAQLNNPTSNNLSANVWPDTSFDENDIRALIEVLPIAFPN